MNFIGLDLSLTSTAMSIESRNKNFLFNYNKKKPDYIWFKEVKDMINFRHHTLENGVDYSDNEIVRLKIYSEISDKIVKDILDNIDIKEKTIIAIEGYSYRSLTSSVLDIVTYSTLVRYKLMSIPNLQQIKILAPTSLKKSACISVYGFVDPGVNKKTGKPLKDKGETRNPEGVAGGDFEKIHMIQAMIDGKLDSPITVYLKDNIKKLSEMSKIPSPFDDICDAFWAKEYVKNKNSEIKI